MYMLRSSFIALSLVGILASSAQAATIVDAAVATKDLSTLVAAVQAADLVGTLNGAGPFTVLAPTNAAFAKLPKGTVKSLLKPENKAALTKVLTCHVISGEVMAKDVLALVKKEKARQKWKRLAAVFSSCRSEKEKSISPMKMAARVRWLRPI